MAPLGVVFLGLTYGYSACDDRQVEATTQWHDKNNTSKTNRQQTADDLIWLMVVDGCERCIETGNCT